MAERKINIIDANTINAMNLYAKEVVRRAKRNLKIKKKIEGKNRVTDNTGDLAKSLSYKIVKTIRGLSIKYYSTKKYADFIEEGVQGSTSSYTSAKKSPFKFKKQNLAEGVVEEWINTKPIKLRDLKTNQFISPTEQAKKQASFLIGRSIANKGIAPRHYFKDAIEETKKRFVMNLSRGMIRDTFKTFKNIEDTKETKEKK
ncbi:MAG: hypothetical protein Unbinned5213contig1001_34 [Prokaryotic dsDNA virus sp.]|nr:MAG: hypothetical protein Unbinned5213contig1001_34 [Prokaryotic dsDNA virus sp.]|tara:strand:+ start:2574 stop:3176 length:603 start_codon:yes stop_codon:yes gene_type:complete